MNSKPILPGWAAPLVIAALTFAAFFPALFNGFVNWDDSANLANNPFYRGLSPAHLKWMFTTFLQGHYTPLAWLSFALDYEAWGLDPFGYHLTSLILHCVNAVLFYRLSLRFLGPRERGAILPAAFAALLFSLHPLRVESVAWATERRDVLSGTFYLLAMLGYLKLQEAAPSQRNRWRTATFSAFLLSLLSKDMAVTLPLALVLLDIYSLKRLPADPRRWGQGFFRGVWREKLWFLVPALACALVAVAAQRAYWSVVPWADVGLGPRLAQALYGSGFYVAKTCVPAGLSPLYEKSFLLDPGPYWFYGGLGVGLTALFVSLRRRWPAGLAAWCFYVLTLLPVLGLVKNGRQTVADRYSYLSCLSLALLGGAALRRFLQSGLPRPIKGLGISTCVLALLALALATWTQTAVWHDSISLWSRVVAVDPGSYLGHGNLAAVLAEAGRRQESERERELALLTEAGAFTRAGELMAERGRLDRAVRYFEKALEIAPGDLDAQKGLELARRRLAEGN